MQRNWKVQIKPKKQETEPPYEGPMAVVTDKVFQLAVVNVLKILQELCIKKGMMTRSCPINY